MDDRSPQDARAFIDGTSFIWHQRFCLGEDVYTPGANDVGWLAQTARLPEDLSGKTVLDIGTTNGGGAFEAERRGARSVLATDIVPASWFGFDQIRDFLGSKVEFRQLSVYELGSVLVEKFDVVLFWGVLYHLRHPLLAIDNVRDVTRELLLLETAVADDQLPAEARGVAFARFYRDDELGHDASNWFSPTVAAVLDWCSSAGLAPELTAAWPPAAPTRCTVSATPVPGEPEYSRVSYERALRCSVAAGPAGA
jgi:tRNA (mo5U34)-methyltransferase